MELPPIDENSLESGIKEYVLFLRANGVETFESCEGGPGHSFPEPTIRFYGDKYEGIKATYLCLANEVPLCQIRRTITVNQDKEVSSPFWEAVFDYQCNRPDKTFYRNDAALTF